MEKKGKEFDYYYGTETKQFSFFRIPRMLVKDPRFKNLSSDAKLLYGLMLDRMGLSMKNGWLDVKNRVYIVYKIEDIMDDLGCSKPTSIKIVRELEKIGLIEKMRSGGGKPDIIYVKNLSLSDTEENKNKEQEQKNLKEKSSISEYQKNASSQEVKKFDFKGQENSLHEVKNLYSYGKNSLLPEVKNLNPNYINNNYTKYSDTDSIYQSNQDVGKGNVSDRIDGIDEITAYRVLVRKNLGYDQYISSFQYKDANLFQEIYETICDVVCVKRKTVRINREDCPYEIVKNRFLKLNGEHIEYVMDCMRNNTTKVANIKAYLLTALYNAPLTINSYYQQQVQHDMYGVG